MVFLHRDGSLTNHSATPSTHYVIRGRTPEDEIRLVWHLGHLASFSPDITQTTFAKEEVAELREKAAQMKREKAMGKLSATE